MAACGALPEPLRLGVAISGGPDSTALTFLLHRWVRKRDGQLLALTIDHRLRADSTKEAADLGTRLAEKNIAHVILPWTHDVMPQSAVHAEARRARYDLLFDACRAQDISCLFLGHHAEDQAETILMRLSKATGIDGLAGMSLYREQDGITLYRPLLSVHKARLEATCLENGLEFVHDPSNDSDRFTRARLRAMQDSLAHAGFTVAKLHEIAREAGMARAQLEESTNDWLKTYASLSPYGVVTLAHDAWKDLSDPMRLRVLSRALRTVGGAEYPPRGASLERLAVQLMNAQTLNLTLGGCIIQLRKNAIHIIREAGLIEEELPLSSCTTYRRWDNRFVFNAKHDFESYNVTIRVLGALSRAMLEKRNQAVAELPAAVRASLPGVFMGQKLICLPRFTGENADLSQQAFVTARFSPLGEFLVKPFCPAPTILT